MIKFTRPTTVTFVQRDTDNENPDLQGPPSKKRSLETIKTRSTGSSFKEVQLRDNKKPTYRVLLQRSADQRLYALPPPPPPTALQPGVGLGLLQEFPPSLPV